MKTVNILGTEYKVFDETQEENGKLENREAYCDPSVKEIHCVSIPHGAEDKDSAMVNLAEVKKQTLRHEIVHAFFYESGLHICAVVIDDSWATNEEMVDWIAIQFPKILKAYEEVGAL